MNKTKIEWVRNPDGSQGFTWNPITGCLNHVNGICKGGGFPCYAYRLANGRLKQRYLANPNVAVPWNVRGKDLHSEDLAPCYELPFYPRFWPERLGQLYWDEAPYHKIKRCKPSGIFVCDMSDLFGIGIPEEWTRRILKEIENKAFWETGDRFYLLTKQPQNLVKWSPFPDNCWVGVTATDDAMALAAITRLKYIQATIKYISFEPLLKRVSGFWLEVMLKDAGIHWLIIGAQTRPYKPPKIEWVEEIVRAADKAGIPVFLKNNLEPNRYEPFGIMRMPLYKRQGKHHTLELRQEMPND